VPSVVVRVAARKKDSWLSAVTRTPRVAQVEGSATFTRCEGAVLSSDMQSSDVLPAMTAVGTHIGSMMAAIVCQTTTSAISIT
jgi:hypothetical protein